MPENNKYKITHAYVSVLARRIALHADVNETAATPLQFCGFFNFSERRISGPN